MSSAIRLRRHALRFLPELRVSDEVLSCRFDARCSMSRCRGDCCREGVDVDVAQRDHILEHAARVQPFMDAGRESDPSRWFGEPFDDPDFPSRSAASTRVDGGACVFLDRVGKCALHRAETEHPDQAGMLKPFFCRAYPLTIVDGVLCLDHEVDPGLEDCCGRAQDGTLSVFEVCEGDIELLLGAEGLAELRRIAASR